MSDPHPYQASVPIPPPAGEPYSTADVPPQPGSYQQPGYAPNSQAGAPAAYPAVPVPVETPISGQLRAVVSPAGLATLAFMTLGVVVTGLVFALLVLLMAQTSGTEPFGIDINPFTLLMLLTGAFLGGGVSMGGSFSTFAASQNFVMFPLGVYLAVIGVLTAILKKRVWSDGTIRETGPTAVRAAVEGIIVSLVVTLLTAFFSISQDDAFFDAGVDFRSIGALTFVMVFLLVGGTDFVVRQRAGGVTPLPGVLARGLRETGRYLAHLFIVFGVIAVIAMFIVAIRFGSPSALFLLPHYLPNIVAMLIGLAYFGGVGLTSPSLPFGGSLSDVLPNDFSGPAEPLFAWDFMSGWGFLLLVFGLIVIFTAAVSVGMSREKTDRPDWSRVWQMPLLSFLVWLVGGLVFVNAHGSGVVGMSGGMTWWSPVLIGLGATAVSLLAEVMPAYLARNLPGPLAFLAGRRTAEAWYASPVRIVERRVQPVPMGQPLAGAQYPYGQPTTTAGAVPVPPAFAPGAGAPVPPVYAPGEGAPVPPVYAPGAGAPVPPVPSAPVYAPAEGAPVPPVYAPGAGAPVPPVYAPGEGAPVPPVYAPAPGTPLPAVDTPLPDPLQPAIQAANPPAPVAPEATQASVLPPESSAPAAPPEADPSVPPAATMPPLPPEPPVEGTPAS